MTITINIFYKNTIITNEKFIVLKNEPIKNISERLFVFKQADPFFYPAFIKVNNESDKITINLLNDNLTEYIQNINKFNLNLEQLYKNNNILDDLLIIIKNIGYAITEDELKYAILLEMKKERFIEIYEGNDSFADMINQTNPYINLYKEFLEKTNEKYTILKNKYIKQKLDAFYKKVIENNLSKYYKTNPVIHNQMITLECTLNANNINIYNIFNNIQVSDYIYLIAIHNFDNIEKNFPAIKIDKNNNNFTKEDLEDWMNKNILTPKNKFSKYKKVNGLTFILKNDTNNYFTVSHSLSIYCYLRL